MTKRNQSVEKRDPFHRKQRNKDIAAAGQFEVTDQIGSDYSSTRPAL